MLVRSLGWEDPLEEGMATHSSILAWRTPGTEDPGGLQSIGWRRGGHLSDFTFIFHFHALEKETAIHSSILAWKIPRTEESGRLQSIGVTKLEHDLATKP